MDQVMDLEPGLQQAFVMLPRAGDADYAIVKRVCDIENPADHVQRLLSDVPVDYAAEAWIYFVTFRRDDSGIDPHQIASPTHEENAFEAAAGARPYLPVSCRLLKSSTIWQPTIRERFETPLTPSGRPLTMRISCKQHPGEATQRHTVRIHADGSVDSKHDLHAEAIAHSLGNSEPPRCLVLAQTVVPILLNELPVLLRRERPAISLGPSGAARFAQELSCCRVFKAHNGPLNIEELADHLRSREHLAGKYDVESFSTAHDLLKSALNTLNRAWGGLATVPESGDGPAAQVSNRDLLQALWDIGIRPEDVPALTERHITRSLQLGLWDEPPTIEEIIRATFPSGNDDPDPRARMPWGAGRGWF